MMHEPKRIKIQSGLTFNNVLKSDLVTQTMIILLQLKVCNAETTIAYICAINVVDHHLNEFKQILQHLQQYTNVFNPLFIIY